MARRIVIVSNETLADQWSDTMDYASGRKKIRPQVELPQLDTSKLDKYYDMATGKTVLAPRIKPNFDMSSFKLPTINVGTSKETTGMVQTATWVIGGAVGLYALSQLIKAVKQ